MDYLSHSHPESDERPQPQSTSLATQLRTEAIAAAEKGLEPGTPDDFRRELTACLALCAATGMSTEDRNEWLRVAWATLKDVPGDLLTLGASKARAQCDHPSKIVPTIMREIEQWWGWRKDALSRARKSAREANEARNAAEQIERVTPAQIEQIKAEVGLVTQPYQERPKATGERRMPTRADYIALGISPDVLDRISAPSDQAA